MWNFNESAAKWEDKYLEHGGVSHIWSWGPNLSIIDCLYYIFKGFIANTNKKQKPHKQFNRDSDKHGFNINLDLNMWPQLLCFVHRKIHLMQTRMTNFIIEFSQALTWALQDLLGSLSIIPCAQCALKGDDGMIRHDHSHLQNKSLNSNYAHQFLPPPPLTPASLPADDFLRLW